MNKCETCKWYPPKYGVQKVEIIIEIAHLPCKICKHHHNILEDYYEQSENLSPFEEWNKSTTSSIRGLQVVNERKKAWNAALDAAAALYTPVFNESWTAGFKATSVGNIKKLKI